MIMKSPKLDSSKPSFSTPETNLNPGIADNCAPKRLVTYERPKADPATTTPYSFIIIRIN